MLSLIQEWLNTEDVIFVTHFLDMFCMWWLLMHRLQPQCTTCEVPPQLLESALVDNFLKTAVIPVVIFLQQFSVPVTFP